MPVDLERAIEEALSRHVHDPDLPEEVRDILDQLAKGVKRLSGEVGRLRKDLNERNIDIIGADLVTDMAADKKLADIVRQFWEDWQCGYDALASYQWDLLKAELGTIPAEPDRGAS